MTKLLISNGELVNSETNSIKESIEFVKTSREWLHKQKIDDILEYVDVVGKNWSDEFSEKIGTNTSHVKDFLSKPQKLLIDGKRVDAVSGATFEVLDPSSNLLLTHVPKGGKEDIDLSDLSTSNK